MILTYDPVMWATLRAYSFKRISNVCKLLVANENSFWFK